MPYIIRCYEGQDEWVSKKWLAHLNLGNDIYISFFGATKAEAEAKGHAWYEKEKKYSEKIDTSRKEPKVKVIDEWRSVPVDVWNTLIDDNKSIVDAMGAWPNPVAIGVNDGQVTASGRGHHFAGKVWMIKEDGWEKKKIRVDKSEVEKYEAEGWKRGGPRS